MTRMNKILPVALLIKFCVLLLLVYPIALLSQVVLDTYIGDGAFLDNYLFESKRRLLRIILLDWLHSLTIIIPAIFLSFVVNNYFQNLIVGKLMLVGSMVVLIILSLTSELVPSMLGLVFAYTVLASTLLSWSKSVD